jgi:hypothetical protein
MITTDQNTRSTRWWRRLLGPVQAPPAGRYTLRYAGPDDAEALQRLADLDSSRAPRGVVLLAEVGEELWAAVSLDDGHTVADPFRPSGELAFLLTQRARQLRGETRGRTHALPRVWPPAQPIDGIDLNRTAWR